MRGKAAHIARLKALTSPKATETISRALFAGADRIKARAQFLITQGSVSGAGHIPSRPGEPPNNDTGILKSNIEATLPSPLVAQVESKAPYAGALEFGTSKMAPRPYMAPAREAERKEVVALVARALDHIAKTGGK